MDFMNNEGFVLVEDNRTLEFNRPHTNETMVVTRNYTTKSTFIAVYTYKNRTFDIKNVRGPTKEEEQAVIQIMKDRGVF